VVGSRTAARLVQGASLTARKAVIDPRGVLGRIRRDASLTDTKIRVWDSTAELRYLVVPDASGSGTDDLGRGGKLADLVTRDSR
jgi:nitrile hydratase